MRDNLFNAATISRERERELSFLLFKLIFCVNIFWQPDNTQPVKPPPKRNNAHQLGNQYKQQKKCVYYGGPIEN